VNYYYEILLQFENNINNNNNNLILKSLSLSPKNFGNITVFNIFILYAHQACKHTEQKTVIL